MTCSRPWHNLVGRTGIRAQTFMPHTSLLHIALSLRLRNWKRFGNRFPFYFFMLLCLRWGVKMKGGPHFVSIIDPSSLFSRVWTQLQICPFCGCLLCLRDSCTGVTLQAVEENLWYFMVERYYATAKITSIFYADPCSFGTLCYY